MRDLIAVTKALADEQRVRVLGALGQGELCVCQLVELLGLAPSTVSKHLALLRQAGLVETRKDGRWVWCRLAGAGAPAVVRDALAWVGASLAASGAARGDRKRLEKILSIDPEVLCCQQRTKARPGGRVSSSSAPATRAAARSRKAGRGRSRAT